MDNVRRTKLLGQIGCNIRVGPPVISSFRGEAIVHIAWCFLHMDLTWIHKQLKKHPFSLNVAFLRGFGFVSLGASMLKGSIVDSAGIPRKLGHATRGCTLIRRPEMVSQSRDHEMKILTSWDAKDMVVNFLWTNFYVFMVYKIIYGHRSQTFR